MSKYAIGLIETYGYTAATEAIDSAFKAAKVEHGRVTHVGRGIVTVTFIGDVAAVKVAVDCGTEAAKKVGNVLSSHVIARLDEQVYGLIQGYDSILKENPIYTNLLENNEKDDILKNSNEVVNIEIESKGEDIKEVKAETSNSNDKYIEDDKSLNYTKEMDFDIKIENDSINTSDTGSYSKKKNLSKKKKKTKG